MQTFGKGRDTIYLGKNPAEIAQEEILEEVGYKVETS